MTKEDLAKRHIDEALRFGKITFEDGTERIVQTSTIVSLARIVLKDSLSENEITEEEVNTPSELFDTFPGFINPT